MMTIRSNIFGQQIVKPVLELFGDYSAESLALMVSTGLIASDLDIIPKQTDSVHFGIYQITADMHKQVWDQYLVNYPDLASVVRGLASQRHFLENPNLELSSNLIYATAITWFYFNLGLEKKITDYPINQLARIWNKQFHPHNNSINEGLFIEVYRDIIQPVNKAA